MLLVRIHHRGRDSPDGQIEVGENLENGLLREILVESGITASVGSLVGVYSNVGRNKRSYVDSQIEVMHFITAPALRFRFEKMLNFTGKVCYSSYVTKPEFNVLTDRYS